MHKPDVYRDTRNWKTWKYGPADSPVVIATKLVLEGA